MSLQQISVSVLSVAILLKSLFKRKSRNFVEVELTPPIYSGFDDIAAVDYYSTEVVDVQWCFYYYSLIAVGRGKLHTLSLLIDLDCCNQLAKCLSKCKHFSVDFRWALECSPRYCWFGSRKIVRCQYSSHCSWFAIKALPLIGIFVADWRWDKHWCMVGLAVDETIIDSEVVDAFESRNNWVQLAAAVAVD